MTSDSKRFPCPKRMARRQRWGARRRYANWVTAAMVLVVGAGAVAVTAAPPATAYGVPGFEGFDYTGDSQSFTPSTEAIASAPHAAAPREATR